MPRFGIDRDDFVARIERRQRWMRYAIRARGLIFSDKRSHQQAIYEATFRSDAEAVAYHYARRNDHLPDLEEPVWLNEKVRWQFLNHPNPLMSYVADKIAVRNYLRFKEARIGAPGLIAIGTDPRELATAASGDLRAQVFVRQWPDPFSTTGPDHSARGTRRQGPALDGMGSVAANR